MSQPLETYQDEIYLAGLTGAVPELPTDLSRLGGGGALGHDATGLRLRGRRGAGSGETARENLAAFGRWRIVPRMLTDVSTPSYATTVLGAELAVPYLLAPKSASSGSLIRAPSPRWRARPRRQACR